MRHEPVVQPRSRPSFVTRRRFQLLGALFFGALVPYLIRGLMGAEALTVPAAVNAVYGNALAVILAMWIRLSIETYPGIRSSYVILPGAVGAHLMIFAVLLLTRLPYDRFALSTGLGLHILWNYFVYFLAVRRARPSIAIVPFGNYESLLAIPNVSWQILQSPTLMEAAGSSAIVADFATDLPREWEAFLADAALDGRMVYQVKQLSESLTGRVELSHLSENSFGSLVPARSYFHLKAFADFILAVALLPIVIPLTALIALAIRLDGPGTIFFRQARVGHAGQRIVVYKFRTMRPMPFEDARRAAMTGQDDERITRVGAFLRRTRLDELPQILNILKWEMSWIGPRPEAEILSAWYTNELPFYRYRHVVKPGISGWAQVNQGHVAEVEEVHRKLQYDFYYIKYFSPWLDLLILFLTVRTVLTGFGSR